MRLNASFRSGQLQHYGPARDIRDGAEATWRGRASQPGGPASTPHRISLRLAARLLRLPLKGGVIREQTGNILYTINREQCRSRLIEVGEIGEAVPTLCGRDARAPRCDFSSREE